MKKILVTGGSGFIGSNFIRYMLNKYSDYNIINLDKLTYAGNSSNLKDFEKDSRYKFVHGDINDKELVLSVLKDVDWVVHFAAESHVDRSIERACDFITTNVHGTFTLLECASEVMLEKFLHISTDEVYGSIKTGSFKETDILDPSSPYSASKASSDLLVKSYYTTFNLPVIITRSSNNFGPYQYPEKVIPLFVTNILKNKKVPLYGKGENVRNWIYVLDNCACIDLVLHNGEIGEIYNIGGDTEISNIELTSMILKILDKDKSMIEYAEDRLGHDYRYSLDSLKAKTLGFKVESSFQDSLRSTIDWYKSNEWWWKNNE